MLSLVLVIGCDTIERTDADGLQAYSTESDKDSHSTEEDAEEISPILQNIENSPESVPALDLVLLVDDASEQRIHAIQLTTSWSVTYKDGTGRGYESDSCHALQVRMDDYIERTLFLCNADNEIAMEFSDNYPPDSISVQRWLAIYAGDANRNVGDLWDKGEPVKIVDNVLLISDDGNDYVYETHAIWSNGNSYYTFRTESGTNGNAAHAEPRETLQEQLDRYLSDLFTEAYAPHYDGLHYSMSQYEETIDDGNFTSTFLWTMYHLGNGLDVPSDFGNEQEANTSLRVTAIITPNGRLDENTFEILYDNSATGPPRYCVLLEGFFPPPPATPPRDFELISDYVELYIERIIEGDTGELARFILIDGGVQDRYVEIAERVIEYYSRYNLVGASVQRVYYLEHEFEMQYAALVRDGNGEMFRINLIYGDGLAGIDVRMFE